MNNKLLSDEDKENLLYSFLKVFASKQKIKSTKNDLQSYFKSEYGATKLNHLIRIFNTSTSYKELKDRLRQHDWDIYLNKRKDIC